MEEKLEFIVEDGVLVQYRGTDEVVYVPSSAKVIGKDAFRLRRDIVTQVVLPEGILELADSAFENCEVLERVYLPESIVRMGRAVFCGCKNLHEVDIPENVTEIKENAFRGCYELACVSIPQTVGKIGEWAFSDCHVLVDIALPACLLEIENGTFCECRKLVSISIPDSVEKIGYAAFRGCSSLKEVRFGKGVKTFGAEGMGGIFERCKSLRSISLPYGVTVLPYSMFRDCYNLSCVELPSSVERFEDDVFLGCASLKKMRIPAAMASFKDLPRMLGADVFSGCLAFRLFEMEGEGELFRCVDGVLYSKDMKSLERIPIGYEGVFDVLEGVEQIGRYAFCGCVLLARVGVSSSVSNLDLSCFDDCKNLVWIDVDKGNPVFSSEQGVLFDYEKSILLRCPPGKKNIYVVGDGVSIIWERAFASCAKLESVSLPDSIEEIGEAAFYECRRLSRLAFDEACVRIGEYAFDGCHRLPGDVAAGVVRYV